MDGDHEPHHLAADADRQRVADRLRDALDAGRLTLSEYDERLGAAYRARTYGELATLTRDLPASPAHTSPGAAPPRPADRGARRRLARRARAWLGGALVTNGIWAASSGLDWHHYWPGPVLLGWAAIVAAGSLPREPTPRTTRRSGPRSIPR